jgi:hypothetical protein
LKLGGPEVWGYFYEVDESVNKIATFENEQALKKKRPTYLHFYVFFNSDLILSLKKGCNLQ